MSKPPVSFISSSTGCKTLQSDNVIILFYCTLAHSTEILNNDRSSVVYNAHALLTGPSTPFHLMPTLHHESLTSTRGEQLQGVSHTSALVPSLLSSYETRPYIFRLPYLLRKMLVMRILQEFLEDMIVLLETILEPSIRTESSIIQKEKDKYFPFCYQDNSEACTHLMVSST